MMPRLRLLPLASLWFTLSLAVPPTLAAADGGPLEEVVVTAPRLEKKALQVPGAVGVVGRDEIQRARQQLTLGESLAGIPGVFTQNRGNFAQDLRISIRGFGARAAFGIRGIKLLVDGIPLTLPDGQGQVDSLQLASAGRIEVLRGPAASLYGSAAGGVIRIESEEAPSRPFVQARSAFGSHGYRSYDVKSAGRRGPLSYLVGLSRLETDGYREYSRMESSLANARLRWDVDDRSDLTALLSFVYSPLAQDPGGLKSAEVEQDRRQAAPRNPLYQAGERVNQFSSGVRYRRTFGEKHELEGFAHFAWRDFRNRLPFENGGTINVGDKIIGVNGGSVAYERLFAGMGMQQSFAGEVFGLPSRLLVGFDLDAQRDDRTRRNNHQGGLGGLTLDQREEVTSVRVFAQEELRLRDDLELTFSLGFDAIGYRARDHFSADGLDDSGERWFDELSPMLGLHWSPAQLVNLYARLSTSFEPPTTTELANPSGAGGFNGSVDPQRAVNYEAGIKGLLPGRLRYELAGYYIRMRNELVSFEQAGMPGRSFYRNANRSNRIGVETALSHQPIEGLTASIAYTYSRAEFERYRTDTANYDGNRIPGVPEHHVNTGIRYRHACGLFGEFDLRYVGALFADDANEVESESHVVADLRVGYEGRFGQWGVAPYVGINNLFDAEYIDNVRLNAKFGRYFEPAPRLEAYGGLAVTYHFEGLDPTDSR